MAQGGVVAEWDYALGGCTAAVAGGAGTDGEGTGGAVGEGEAAGRADFVATGRGKVIVGLAAVGTQRDF